MRKTKFVALLLVVALIASMVVPGVSAAEDYAIKIQSNNSDAITVNAGESFMAKVNLSGNPGISGIATKLVYPEGWTLNAVRNEKLFDSTATSVFTPSETYEANPYSLMWTMPYGTIGDDFEGIPGKQLSFENGLLAQIKLTVPADAVSGTYEVYLTTEGLEKSNYAEPVDASGTIITGEVTRVIPDTSAKLTITVIGNEPEAPAAAPCEKCGEVSWTDWDGTADVTAGGHFKLTKAATLAGAITIPEGVTTCIDLNGFELAAASGKQSFVNNGTLVIMDSSENETGSVKGNTVAVQGANIKSTGTFYLYGGTITGGDATGNATTKSYGGNIYSTGSLHLLGGAVTDGNAYHTTDSGTGRGGNVYVAGGSAVIENCLISGGTAECGGNLYLAARTEICGDTQILGGVASSSYAGGIYVSGCTVDIYDNAIISGGRCETSNGGNFYMTGAAAVVTVKGNAQIKEGYAQAGGNIFANSKSTLKIQENAQIKDGTAFSTSSNWGGGNIFAFTDVVCEITGGTISGGTAFARASSINARSNAKLEISGTAVIDTADGTLPAMTTYASGVITVKAGATLACDPSTYLACEAANYAAATGKYTTYATLAEALTAAAAGDKVTLGMDATAASVAVPAGATLDLNGKVLTAEAFTSAVEGAQTIDSVGTGKLVSSSASFAADNAQLPVEVNGAFTFEAVQFAHKYEEVGTKATYKFYIAAEAAATLIDDAILAGDDVALQVKVTWTDANGDAQDKTFVLGAADLALYAGNWDTKMIILTIADISAVSNVNCVAQIVANSVTVGA